MTLRGDELLGRLTDERVGVYGFGTTGQAVVEHLMDHAGSLTVLEDTPPERAEYDPDDWPDRLSWWIGPDHFQNELDRLIVSPGVPGHHPFVRQVREAGVPVWGELELAYRLCEGRIWGVTGTNGKSTCTELIGAALEVREGPGRVSVCGNRGRPLMNAVMDPRHNAEEYAVEVSSFQVEGFDAFTPDASLLTNLGDDHRDRHRSLHEYHGLKWQLLKRTRRSGRVVVPARHRGSRRWLDRRPDVVFVAGDRTHGLETDVHLKDGELQVTDGRISLASVPPVLGLFPENLLASLALVFDRPTVEDVRGTLERFSPPPHRVEALEVRDGVRVINDSKGTNPHAVLSLVENVDAPVRLLLGGGGKNVDYEPLVRELAARRVRDVRLCGEGSACGALEALLREFDLPYRREQQWEDGVKDLVREAQSGEWVLLSPGGTSFDAFRDYRQRGEAFRRWVDEVSGP